MVQDTDALDDVETADGLVDKGQIGFRPADVADAEPFRHPDAMGEGRTAQIDGGDVGAGEPAGRLNGMLPGAAPGDQQGQPVCLGSRIPDIRVVGKELP